MKLSDSQVLLAQWLEFYFFLMEFTYKIKTVSYLVNTEVYINVLRCNIMIFCIGLKFDMNGSIKKMDGYLKDDHQKEPKNSSRWTGVQSGT